MSKVRRLIIYRPFRTTGELFVKAGSERNIAGAAPFKSIIIIELSLAATTTLCPATFRQTIYPSFGMDSIISRQTFVVACTESMQQRNF